MKKIYQTPCTDVTVVCTMQMLAVSMDKHATGGGAVLTREKNDRQSGVGGGLWSDMK